MISQLTTMFLSLLLLTWYWKCLKKLDIIFVLYLIYSVCHQLSTDVYYHPWPDCLLTISKIEVCMLSRLPWRIGHSHSVDTCTCEIDSTRNSLESVYSRPVSHVLGSRASRKHKNLAISPIIYLHSFSSAWCCTKSAQILTPSL